jgi:2-C-methyl-D-erythritol 4-phosphate cytidylyltransferase
VPAIEGGKSDIVVIHDAARPLAVTTAFASVFETASMNGGAVPVRDPSNLSALYGGDPPHPFGVRPLLGAYRLDEADCFVGTDTAGHRRRESSMSHLRYLFPHGERP